MAILETHNLAVGYRQGKRTTTLLSGLNLTLAEGMLVALLGRNGAGKSTLLRALTGDEHPLDGTITLAGSDITAVSKRRLSQLIALVATERVMEGAFTVRELVALGRQPHTGFLGRLGAHDREVVEQCLNDVGITHMAERHIASLSDGERQKAMIARALAQETPIIVLDEPTAFLDVASRIETMKLLHRLAHEHRKAVLLSSHDISQSLLLADALWVITGDNRLVAGTTEEVVMAGTMNEVFGNSSIVFNADMCDYEAQLPVTKTVALRSDDPQLARCVTNALLRNGIAVAADAEPVITAHGIKDFSTSDGKHHTSLEQLVRAIAG